jgi:EmrB/QacA subfamily drug resistance transporter
MSGHLMQEETAGANHAALKGREKTVLVLLCASQFMIVLDGTIMNVAIASIQQSLGLSQQGLQWVINAYALAFGGFLLFGGRAADLLGRRRVLIAGMTVFSFASLIGGLANEGGVLIAARALQGLGGALASPASMSLVAELFAAGPKRDRAFGAMGAVAAVGAASGVLLGGLLTGLLGWQWVLLVNVPIGAVVVAAAFRLLPHSRSEPQMAALNLPSAATVTLALVTVVYAVVGTSTSGWLSVRTLLLFAASAALLVLFMLMEKRSAHPLLPLAMLRSRRLLAAVATAFVHATGPIATLYFLSLHFQQQLGYSPLQTGLAFLPLALAAAIGAALASRLVGRFGTLAVMLAGLAVMAIGLALLAPLPAPASYLTQLLPGIVIVGVGITLAGVPMTIAAVSAVRAQDSGLSSGLLNTSQQIGAALALALLVALSATAPNAERFVQPLTSARIAFVAACAILIAGAALAWLIAPKRNGPARPDSTTVAHSSEQT